MKRNFFIAATLISVFTGVSCEKHNFNDTVEVRQEMVPDEDGNLHSVGETYIVPQDKMGTVRFFKETPKKKEH